MATYTQSQANFIATELPLAQRESRRTGIPVSVFLTQSWNETGHGTSKWFLEGNNPAGIGVTGAPGAGNGFATLSAAFRTYADRLMGIGEAGQQQFVADVHAGAGTPTLLADLEASPWAAGHYGGTAANPGHGLEQLYAAEGLGTFDAPGAKAPTGATPIHTVAYIPGTGIHLPGTGSGSNILPSNPITGAAGAVLSPLIDFLKQGAIRASLVVFGAVAVLLGLALLVRDASDSAKADTAGATAGKEERAEARELGPSGGAPPARTMTPPAPQESSPRTAAPDGGGHPIAADVAQTSKGAVELAAG